MSLTALILALSLQTQGTVTVTPVADLIGLTPSQVADRLGARPDPVGDEAVRLVDGGRVIEIYPIQRFWREPAMHGDIGVVPEGMVCLSGVVSPVPGEAIGSSDPGGLVQGRRGQFVFVDGVLRSVHVAAPRVHSGSPPSDLRSAREYSRRRAQDSPWPTEPGQLLLSDGGAVVARLTPASGGDAVVKSVCRPRPEPSDGSSTSGDWALALAGAATLWPVYAVTQPFVSAENDRAEREGGALLAQLSPGLELAQSPEDLVRRRRGVRLFRDNRDPDYAVVAIKLGRHGSAPGVALVGLSSRRVVWTAGPDATRRLGLSDALCLSDQGLLDDHRPGCSAYGYRP